MAKVISSLAIKVGAKAEGVKKGMADATKATQDFGKKAGDSFASAGKRLAAFVAGAVLAIGSLRAMSDAFGSIDRIAKFADEVGFTTEQLASWRLGAELTGTSITTLEKGLQIFTRRLGEAKAGIGEGVKGFKALGLSAMDLANMNPAEAFKQVAQAISELPTAADRAAAAFAIFGRQGQELMTFLMSGRKGISDFEKEAKKLGITFSREMARDVENANDAIARMKFAAKGLTQQLAIALAPAIMAIADAIQGLTRFFGGFDKQTARVVLTITAAVAAFVGTIAAINLVIRIVRKIITVFRQLAKAQILVKALSGPKGWLALAAGLAVAAGTTALVSKQFDKLDKNAAKASKGADQLAKSGKNLKKELTEPTKEATEAMKKAAAEAEKWARIGERLTERFKKPFDAMIDRIKEAQGAIQRGVITWGIYEAAVNDAVKQFEAADRTTRRLNQASRAVSIGAAVRGTSQGLDAVHRGRGSMMAVAQRLEDLKRRADTRRRLLAQIRDQLKLNGEAIRNNQVVVRQHRIN